MASTWRQGRTQVSGALGHLIKGHFKPWVQRHFQPYGLPAVSVNCTELKFIFPFHLLCRWWKFRNCTCPQPTGAEVLSLLPAPGAVALSRSLCLVLSFSRAVSRQIKLCPEFLNILVLFCILGCSGAGVISCFPVVWPSYNCAQYKSHPMAQEVADLWRESPSFNSINVEANFHPEAESQCLWSQ